MDTIESLLAGYQRFRRDSWQTHRERWKLLGQGQSPRTLIISCSDSRVDPAQIFDCKPGELFVVRNVAALVPPYETSGGQHGVSAALEFAVQFLAVEEIIIMGHAKCGGCHAALHRTVADNSLGEGGFVANWISLLDEASASIRAAHENIDDSEVERAMEWAAIQVSLANLRSFPFVVDKEKQGKLRLHGAFFSIEDGQLYLLQNGEFAPL